MHPRQLFILLSAAASLGLATAVPTIEGTADDLVQVGEASLLIARACGGQGSCYKNGESNPTPAGNGIQRRVSSVE